jgi:catechol 2,3-dioxygenase-like lactoylglutathione lyase family enzyme
MMKLDQHRSSLFGAAIGDQVTMIGFSHVAVGVRDMDRALGFYRDALGFEVRRDVIEEWPARGVLPQMSRRAVYLQYVDYLVEPGSTFLVLDQQLSSEPVGGPHKLGELGVNHFGMWVSDLDALVERARSHGCETVAPARVLETSASMGESPGHFSRGVAYYDPEGNVVQIDQRVPGPAL